MRVRHAKYEEAAGCCGSGSSGCDGTDDARICSRSRSRTRAHGKWGKGVGTRPKRPTFYNDRTTGRRSHAAQVSGSNPALRRRCCTFVASNKRTLSVPFWDNERSGP